MPGWKNICGNFGEPSLWLPMTVSFLDRVTNRILEISHGQMYSYPANYSQFLEMKAEREEMELASERKRQSVLRMELEWAKRGCRARSTKQRSRLERLEALKKSECPGEGPDCGTGFRGNQNGEKRPSSCIR